MNISVHCLKSECFPALKEIGFYGVDLSFDNQKPPEDMLDFAGKALDSGLKISQTHLWPPHFRKDKDDFESFVKEVFPVYKRQIEVTAKIGSPVAVMHPYGNEDYDLAKKGTVLLIEKLLPIIRKTSIALAVENIYGDKFCRLGFSTAEELLYITDCFKGENIGICFDTGHALLQGINVTKTLEKIKNCIKALHIHTTIPIADMHSIPYSIKYHESIKWKEFIRILKESEYKGTFNLEIKPPLEYSIPSRNAFYKMAYEVSKDIIEDRLL